MQMQRTWRYFVLGRPNRVLFESDAGEGWPPRLLGGRGRHSGTRGQLARGTRMREHQMLSTGVGLGEQKLELRQQKNNDSPLVVLSRKCGLTPS
jgi:hypothetical protein